MLCSRERRKQKFDFLECEVVRLSTAVAQQERQKVELLAQIQVLQTRHSLEKPSQSRLLPQLQEVSFQHRNPKCCETYATSVRAQLQCPAIQILRHDVI